MTHPRAASMVVNGALDKNLDYIDRESFDYDSSDRSEPLVDLINTIFLRLGRKQIDILKLAALLQMTSVGAPMIYYGTEVGMHGGDDPDDRMPMVWGDLKYENRTKGPRGLRPQRQQAGPDQQ